MSDTSTGAGNAPSNVFSIDRMEQRIVSAEAQLRAANEELVRRREHSTGRAHIDAAVAAVRAAKDELAAAKRAKREARKPRAPVTDAEQDSAGFPVDHPDPGVVALATLAAIEVYQAELPDDDKLYSSAGAVVRVIDRGRGTNRAPVIEAAPAEVVGAAASSAGRFYSVGREGAIKPARCPEHVAKLMVEIGKYPLPELWGISDVPVMAEDGRVCMEEGYSPTTKLILNLEGTYYPQVPATPDRNIARLCLDLLCEPFAEFPLESRGQRSVILSMILSVLARPMIKLAPIHLVDATQAGGGKSFIAQGVERIVTRNPRVSVKAITWLDKPEEQTKLLVSAAQTGARIVRIENLSPKVQLGGSPLEGAATEIGWTGRLLSLNEFSTPLDATIYATGNNVSVTRDAMRRTIRCRVVPKVAAQHKRTDFAIKDFLGFMSENHARLLSCALTVLRAVVVADPQDVKYAKRTDHYRAWSDVVARALVWLGEEDPNAFFVDEATSGVDELPADITAKLAFMRAVEQGHDTAQGIMSLFGGLETELTTDLKDAIKVLVPGANMRELDSYMVRDALKNARGVVTDPESGVDMRLAGYSQNAARLRYALVLGDAPAPDKNTAAALADTCRLAREAGKAERS